MGPNYRRVGNFDLSDDKTYSFGFPYLCVRIQWVTNTSKMNVAFAR